MTPASQSNTPVIALSVTIPLLIIILLAAVVGWIRHRRSVRMRGSASKVGKRLTFQDSKDTFEIKGKTLGR